MKVEYTEPLDEELLAFVRNIPLMEGYSILASEYVFPWSVNEVWDNIYDSGAPYSFDIALEDLGDVFITNSDWENPETDDSFIDGQEYQLQKTAFSKSKLPPNPFYSWVNN